MKKYLILFLILSVVLCFVSCGGSEDTPSASSEEPGTVSEVPSSAESAAASSEEPAPASSEEITASSEEESKEESVEVSEEPGIDVADFITQYVSFGATIDDVGEALIKARCTDATSVRVTGVNEGAVDDIASVLVFNFDYNGFTIASEKGSYDDYAVYVLEYNPKTFHYEKTQSYKVEDEGKDSVKIPDDGFVLAIHSYFDDYIKAVDATAEGQAFFPHGFRATNIADARIPKKTVTVDGNVGDLDHVEGGRVRRLAVDGEVTEEEYGGLTWDIVPDSGLANFAQFEVENYYASGKVHFCYDDDYLYVGVIVSSPYHNNPLTQDNASGMWKYECIQINTTSVSPAGEYFFENWDNAVNSKAVNDGMVRQYGFAVNDEGESISCVWIPSGATFGGETVCVRDDGNQTTVYEAKIPWNEVIGDIEPKEGTVLGVSISLNAGNDTFKNILLRDGGGIIGLNDWTNVPVITLG